MKQEKTSSPQIGFDQIVSRGCGLDVHDKTVVATIDGDGIVRETRTFETYTCSLNELRDWLRMHSVTRGHGINWRVLETYFQYSRR
jgi:hypothetical protein